jgi:crotonobetainyl-CoA:carnitine CoA-transferase CaiB-like acyl-CoA transferase
LAGVNVVEWAGGLAAGFAGRWLAAFGAHVTMIEPPEGHWSRRSAIRRGPDAPRGSLFRYLSAGKTSQTFDPDRDEDRDSITSRLAAADILIHDQKPANLTLDLASIRSRNPALSVVEVSPFGHDGPYAELADTPLTMLAMTGWQFIVGDPKRAPLSLPGFQSEYMTGLYTAIAALSLLAGRRQGATAEVTAFEAIASLLYATHGANAGNLRRRNGNRYQDLYVNSLLPCKDGFVSFACYPQDMWERLCALIGHPEMVADPRFETNPGRFQNADEIDEVMRPWLMSHDRQEIFHTAQSWRLPCAPCYSLAEVIGDASYQERGYWAATPEDASLVQPGFPTQMSRTPWRLGSVEAAPAAGAGVDGSPASSRPAANDSASDKPLAGIRIIDFTQVWAGPISTRILSDLGAEVIRVERPPDPSAEALRLVRRGGQSELHRNKLGLALDLQQDAGRDIFRALVARADVLVENFAARVMPNFGLDYENLKQINPGLIMLSLTGFGQSGPYRDYSAFGPAIEPMTGLTTLLGYPGEDPMSAAIAYADPIAGATAVAAVLTALVHRQRTGEGQYVDLSMIEATTNIVGEHFIDRQLSGTEPPRLGNRHPEWAPQGTFRCVGQDQWVSLSIRSDDEWQRFCETSGLAALTRPELATVDQRMAHEDEIELAIGGWTATLDKFETARILQAAGIPARAVVNANELRDDPQFAHSGFFVEFPAADGETFRVSGTPIKFDGRRHESWRAAPQPGEHTFEVLSGLLGMSPEAIAGLSARGVIGVVPMAAAPTV